ncbi:MAG: HIT family protein, partial [Deferrisomatales bacterium]
MTSDGGLPVDTALLEGDGCPFCDLTSRDLIAENALAVAFRDGFPVNPGHTLIIPRRHVATWFDATRQEQLAILELADQVKADLDAHGVGSSGTGGQGPGIGEPTTDPSSAGPQSLTPGPCRARPPPPNP